MIWASRALLNKLGGNLFDQALSAISNVVLAIVVARSLDAVGFGSFSIAFLTYGIAFAALKSIVGQPLQIRYSASPPEHLRDRIAEGMGATVAVSIVAGVGCVLAGVGLGGTIGEALGALGVWLPALLLQDCCRMAFFAADRPWSAAVIDAVWALVQFPVLAALVLGGNTSLWWLIGAWGGGAAVSAAVGLAILRVRPLLSRARAWLVEHASLGRYLLAEYGLGLGSAQLGILLVGIIVGETGVGSLRAAQCLLGPVGILGAAAFQFAVPEIARTRDASARRLQRFGGVVSGGLLIGHLAYISLLLMIPDGLGVELFGDSWAGAETVLLAMSVAACCSSLANGPAGVLYGLGWARTTFRINLVKGPLLLVAVPLATWLWGAIGAAWALTAIEAVILPFWAFSLIKATRLGRAPADEPATVPAESPAEA